jgi:hypothetical protein
MIDSSIIYTLHLLFKVLLLAIKVHAFIAKVLVCLLMMRLVCRELAIMHVVVSTIIIIVMMRKVLVLNMRTATIEPSRV